MPACILIFHLLHIGICTFWLECESCSKITNGVQNGRKGVRSIVLERSETLRASGAGIGILANGWRALEQLGVASHLRKTALPIQRYKFSSTIIQSFNWFCIDLFLYRRSEHVRGELILSYRTSLTPYRIHMYHRIYMFVFQSLYNKTRDNFGENIIYTISLTDECFLAHVVPTFFFISRIGFEMYGLTRARTKRRQCKFTTFVSSIFTSMA